MKAREKNLDMRNSCRIDQACPGQAAASGKPEEQFWTAPGN